ncbi:hypothetical protein BSL78_00979 [Apostichopus japonicus]|uniref:Uncharacterized protein n=1 Tax=Stichopus japonicus TaxID=307972 RepID=A0A2G8LPB0_STIJA|nr:hypothetical protein BSL78_00979 [Apostichopus japonicus]
MAATIEKKHKLSSTETPCPKRTYVTAISNSAEVEKNTKTIFKIILKSKFGHKQHAGSRIVTKERKETKSNEDEEESQESQEGSLNSLKFTSDIESDSIGSGAAKSGGDGDEIRRALNEEEDEEENDPERQKAFEDVATRLARMGDDFEANWQGDGAIFEQELLSCATSITSKAVYQSFEATMDTFLNNQQQSLPDPSDPYKVALVMLCTQKAISLANISVQAASSEADELINLAVRFVSNHFPTWLGGSI